MAKTKTYLGQWKSDAAETKFRASEAVLWERAQRQPESVDVATHHGQTRVYRWPGDGEPVVFIHGMTDTSVRWVPFADALAGHDVYAVDVMGEVGQSRPEVAFTSAVEYTDWFGETVAALSLDRPHVVGYSLGGYVAFSYACSAAEVASLTAFDPVGIVDLKLAKLMSWSAKRALGSMAPAGMRPRLASSFDTPLIVDDEAMAMLRHATRGHPFSTPPCPVLTDAELEAITVPVRVLIGAESALFDVGQLRDRIVGMASCREARLIEDAGHSLVISHFDECLAAVRAALGGDGG